MKRKWLTKMTAIAMALTMTAAAVSPVMAAETAQDNGTEIIAEDIADEESVGEGIVGPLYQEDCTPDEEGKYKVGIDTEFENVPDEYSQDVQFPDPQISAERALPGETVTVATNDTDNFVFKEMSVYVEPQGGGVHMYKTTDTSFEMPAAKVIVTVTYTYVEPVVGPVPEEGDIPEHPVYRIGMSVYCNSEASVIPSDEESPQPKITGGKAVPGETVTFDPGAKGNWTCDEITIQVEPKGGGTYAYKTTDTSFEMPNGDVCIEFRYTYHPRIYSITLKVEDTIYDRPIPTLSRMTAQAGDTVTIYPDERNYYFYTGYSITNIQTGQTYRVDNEKTFKMPHSDIIVEPLYASIGTPPIAYGCYDDMKDRKNVYYAAVYWSSSADVLDPRDTGNKFGINDKCTRGTAAFALWRMSHRLRPDLSGKLNFTDVPEDHEYYRAILWANQKGIAKGYSDGTFGINRNITRGEFIMMLWRYNGSPQPKAVSKAPFKDVSKTNAFYKASLWAYQNGVAKGYKDGTFGVNKAITKADMALMMFRTLPKYMQDLEKQF